MKIDYKDYLLLKKLFTPTKDCIINTIFIDANDPDYERYDYCKLCCNFKCSKGLDYKKIV